MLTDEQLSEALKLIDSRYQKVTEKYLRKVGETINKIGELNASSINRLIQFRRMGVDVRTINRELRKVTGLTKKDLKKLYKKAAQEANTDARFSYVAKGVEPDNVRWEALVEDIWRQTSGTMDNLSNSTVVADSYKAAVDEAIQAVTMGVADYNSAIRDTIQRTGAAGMKVQYESGARKRLDSAVRANILDGVRQVQQKAQELIGEEIGADGVEITAHPYSAPDHEPVQGRQFDLDNFEKMQSGRPFEDTDGRSYKALSRPITQWNCRHLIYYIVLGVSKPMYTEEQLQQWKEDNQSGCTIDGKHYTTYQATQLMRRLDDCSGNRPRADQSADWSGLDWACPAAYRAYKGMTPPKGALQAPFGTPGKLAATPGAARNPNVSQVGTHFYIHFSGGVPIRTRKSFRDNWPVWTVFSVVVLWLGALAATAYEDGMNLFSFMEAFAQAMGSPMTLKWKAHAERYDAKETGYKLYADSLKPIAIWPCGQPWSWPPA